MVAKRRTAKKRSKKRAKTKATASGWFCGFDDDKYDEWLSRIEHKIDRVLVQIASIKGAVITEGADIMAVKDDVDALVAEVANQKTVADSVVALLNNLTAIITNLAANTTDAATAQALRDAVAAVKANDQEIADAVTANTPASGARK